MLNVEKALGDLRGSVDMNTAETVRLRGDVSRLGIRVHRLNATVRQLHCLDPDTDAECPLGLDASPPGERASLPSIDDEEESSVVRAAVEAATGAAVRAVREHRSAPARARLSWAGWTLEGHGSLVGTAALIITVVVALATGHLTIH